MILYCLRHGTTDWTLAARYQGMSDPPLNAQGRSEAAAMGAALATRRFDRVLSSPLGRCRQTWEAMAPQLDGAAPLVVDPRLREIHYGAWEGRTQAEVLADDPHAFDAWNRDPTAAPPPGGEPVAAVAARVGDLLQELHAERERHVLLISHRTVLRILVALLLGVPLSAYRRRLDHAPAALTVLDVAHPEEARLALYNVRPGPVAEQLPPR